LILKKRNNIKKKMNAIPEEFQIKTLLNQDTYLVDGELKNGKVKHQRCSQRFLQKTNTNQQYWDLFHLWEKKAWRQSMPLTLRLIMVRVWPTMKVADRIKSMTRFVTQMEATREEVVKYLMWEIGKSSDSQKNLTGP
jgi:glyceraldehyde-3-phosphate dehydrogenase (NADP+)